MSLLTDFLTALQFLTRIPVPALPYSDASLPRATKFFPAVGLLAGSIAAGAHFLLAPHLPRLAAAVLTIALLVLVTGAFHEDGLADTADGFGGGWSREQVLAILRDSRIGSYGGAALAPVLLARVTLLAAVPLEQVARTLIAAHILCRWTTLPLSYFLPAARPAADGQGARVAQLVSPLQPGVRHALHGGRRAPPAPLASPAGACACLHGHVAVRPLLPAPDRRRDRRLLRRHQPAH